MNKFLNLLFSILISATAWANPAVDPALVEQPSRPSVEQVEHMLKNYSITSAPVGTALPKVTDKPKPELQNNFDVWNKEIREHAAEAIVTFEKNVPGATFAFVGRDMAVLADLFEAFYRSIGQTDRVVRINMSSATVESLNAGGSAYTIEFLKSSGLKMAGEPKHPIVFVDAISRGGGRQIRFLLKSIFDEMSKRGVPLEKTVANYLGVGLKVYTTSSSKSEFLPLTDALKAIATYQAKAKTPNDPIQNAGHSLMLYDDKYTGDGFQRFNEAGYTHWTGAWHESYGPVQQGPNNSLHATPGVIAPQAVREALLQFQALVVNYGHSPELKQSVIAEAKKQGYEFPMRRPESLLNLSDELAARLRKARSADDKLAVFEEIRLANLGRISEADLSKTVAAQVLAAKGTTIDDVLKMSPKLQFDQAAIDTFAKSSLANSQTASQFIDTLEKTTKIYSAYNWKLGPKHEYTNIAVNIFDKTSDRLNSYEQIAQRIKFENNQFESISATSLRATTSFDEFLSVAARLDKMQPGTDRTNLDAVEIALEKYAAKGDAVIEFSLARGQRSTGIADQVARNLMAAHNGDKYLLLQKIRAAKLSLSQGRLTWLVTQSYGSIRPHLEHLRDQKDFVGLKNELEYLNKNLNEPSLQVEILHFGMENSQNIAEYFNWIESNSSLMPVVLSIPVQRSLSRLIALNPSVDQINSLAKTFPSIKDDIYAAAINNTNDREQLKRLNYGTFRKADVVKAALAQFEARNPKAGFFGLFGGNAKTNSQVQCKEALSAE